MKSNYNKVGDFIRLVKEKNSEGLYSELLGINIDKFFMPSVANINGVDLCAYKVVRKDQFACNRMHVGRDYRIPISLSRRDEPFLVSPAYDVFEIKDTSILLPEYLMMWFSRKEFDRNAWFYTDADVRGGLPWSSFCEIELPVPAIERQLEIVREYNTIVKRISLNEELIQKLEETAQAIYKQWFICDFNNNKDEVLLDELVILSKETLNPQTTHFEELLHFSIPDFDSTGLASIWSSKDIRSNKYIVKDNSILFSKLNPLFSRVWNLIGINEEHAVCSTEFLVLVPIEVKLYPFIYYFLKSENTIEILGSMATGTSNSHQRVKPTDVLNLKIEYFDIDKAACFGGLGLEVLKIIRLNLTEIEKLRELKNVFLSKMTKVEENTEKQIL